MQRREFLRSGVGFVTFSLVPTLSWSQEASEDNGTAARIAKFIGDAKPDAPGLTLTMPEIAENGNTVPLTVEVDSPMTADNYVKEIVVFAQGNPSPDVVRFEFSPLSGEAKANTRMRLAKTQEIIALARMSDGSVAQARQMVKVTIGGCGG